jgi:fatty-acyl-CoA synthase
MNVHEMNVGRWIYKRSVTDPTLPFLKDEDGGGRSFNNREFNERTNRMAHALIALGVTKGDRVSIIMLNSSEFLEIFFACAKIGAILVPINFRLATPEIAYMVNDSGPRVFVYTSDFADKAADLKKETLSVVHWFRHSGAELSEDRDIAAFAEGFPAGEPELPYDVSRDDPLLIMYTSGTTGDPRGAVLTHQNVVFDSVHNLILFSVNKGFKSLVTAPLYHVGPLGASTTPVVYAGGSLVLKRFFNASEIIKLIMREKINYMFTVPVMYQMMTEAAEWEAADFSHVHYFFSGAAPMPVSVIKRYQDEKGVRFAQGYGMTEALQISALPLEDSITKAGSVGKEDFHVMLRIVDDDDNDVAEGETGEIIINGPTVFAGYWNKPKETEEAIRGGWFHTGDMAKKDADGFLFIEGRKKELIISSGINIYPAEVEKAIQSITQVKETAAVGMPDAKRGEVVAAFVSLNEGDTLTENELIEKLSGKIAPFKLPRKVFFVDDFPRNTQGKILKKELKRQLETR